MQAPDVVEALTPLVEAFEQLGIPYYIGGSVASSVLGLSRSTLDVDVIADIQATQARALAQMLQGAYYIDEQMIVDAIRSRTSFNVIYYATSYKVDVFIPKQRSFDQQAARRTVQDTLDEAEGSRLFNVVSPEDLILAKLEWYRLGGEVSDRQWNDILGVLKLQGPRLDMAYLHQWAQALVVLDLLERALVDAGLSGA